MTQFLKKYLNPLLLIALILAGLILLVSIKTFNNPHHPPPDQSPTTRPQPLEIADPTTTQTQDITLSPLSSITWSTQPIAQLGWQKVPRLDLVAPKGTAMALRVYLDKNLVCDLNGIVEAQVHRPFGQGFRVDGACDKLPPLSHQDQHVYQVVGYIKLPEDEPQSINVTTGSRLMSEVLIPSVEINWQGDVKIVLAIK